MPERSGIVALGNWIVDKVRTVERGDPMFDPVALREMLDSRNGTEMVRDFISSGNPSVFTNALRYPIVTEGQLTHITDVGEGTGGAPYNVLIDVATLGVGVPLGAVGIVGSDSDGGYILNDLARHGIDSSGMKVLDKIGTSTTDVYEPTGGNRGFGHFSAVTNDMLSFEDIEANSGFIGKHGICHAGYALLLKALDAPDGEYGTKMARALKMIRGLGVKTSLAVVTDRDASRFPSIVRPSLRHTTIFMPNEAEAANTTGIVVKDQRSAEDAAKMMFNEFGVGELVVIHMGEGGSLGMLSDGTRHYQPAHKVDSIKGTAGAGDAFEAGMLYALHQGGDFEYGMRLGTAMAAICLGGRTCTDSMMDLPSTERFMNATPYRR